MATRILIAGYYGFGNLGDEAILQVLLSDLKHSNLKIEPVVLSNSPSETSAQFDVGVVSWHDLAEIGRLFQSAEALIIGGGGLLHDYWPPEHESLLAEPHHGLLLYSNLIAQARLLNVPVLAYGLGVGPLRTPLGGELVAAILRQCCWIGLRDIASSKVLTDIGVSRDQSSVTIGSDLAIRHPSIRQSVEGARGKRLPINNQVLAVNLRYWEFDSDPDKFADLLAKVLDLWLSKPDRNLVFVPFQSRQQNPYEDDFAYSRHVAQKISYQDRLQIIQPINFHEASRIFESVSIAFTSRYHASLLGLSLNIPTLILSYDQKLNQLAAEFGKSTLPLKSSELRVDQLSEWLEESEKGNKDSLDTLPVVRAAQQRGEETLDRFLDKLESAISIRQPNDPIQEVSHLRLIQAQTTMAWTIDHGFPNDPLKAAEHLYAEVNRLEDNLQQAIDEASSLRSQQATLHQEHDKLQAGFESVEAQANRLQSELFGIRSTLGFKILQVYWRIARFLLPEGTSRRRVVVSLNRGLRRVADRVFPGRILGAGREVEATAEAEWVLGHQKAFNTFAREELAQAEISAIIVAPTPFDPKQGQRSVNIAEELSKRGIPVLFAYWRWSLEDRRNDFSPRHKIFQTPLDLLLQDPYDFLAKFASDQSWLICEFPYWELFELIATAHGAGWTIIYDLIDDWRAFSEAGQAPWYRQEFEGHLLRTADLVLASSKKLLEIADLAGAEDPILVPNAASARVKRKSKSLYLQNDGMTLGYFGNLSPAWFDWDLIVNLAQSRPTWTIELIGPISPNQPSNLPGNVKLLGSIDQELLGDYTASWVVAIAPFKTGPIADAVDAIKVYEYLALGLPVIISGISPPIGSEEFVIEANGMEGYLRQLELVKVDELDIEKRVAYAASNSWRVRVDQLLDIISQKRGRLWEKEALFH